MEYLIHLTILVGLYLILAQSLNFTFGLGRLFNLAHVAVYAIGAYTTALLSVNYEMSPLICIPLSMLLGAVLAIILGGISLRLEHDHFAIGSLAFSAVISAILINWKSVTRGVLGIPGIPRPAFWGLDFQDNSAFLLLTYAFVFITGIVLYPLFHGRLSRRLRAQAEHPQAAMSLGVNIVQARISSFFLSSLFAGLAGSLFAYYINYIDPSSFGLHEMVFILSIVVIGSPGSFWGIVLATFFLVLLPEPLRFLEISPSILGPMRQFLYAAILCSVVFWKREHIFPLQRSV